MTLNKDKRLPPVIWNHFIPIYNVEPFYYVENLSNVLARDVLIQRNLAHLHLPSNVKNAERDTCLHPIPYHCQLIGFVTLVMTDAQGNQPWNLTTI